MKKLKQVCLFQRLMCALLVMCFTVSFVPAFASGVSVDAGIDKPVLIYMDKDFETQNEGDIPNGFYFQGGINEEYFKVQNVPTDDNPNNMAANFMGHDDSSYYARQLMYYAPADRDFVVSMDFMVNNDDVKTIKLIHGVDNHNDATYIKGGSSFELISISDSILIGKNIVYPDIKANSWYNIQFLLKLNSDRIAVKVNGQNCGEFNMAQSVDTVDAIRFDCASEEGSDWYIDNYRSYVSDTFLSDDEYAADLEAYEKSSLRPPERYETSRAWRLNPYAFHTLYGEFVMSIGGIRFWKYDRFYTLPTPLEEINGRIIIPLRTFAESFGADVQWSPEGILLVYGDTTLRFVQNSDTYYVNGMPSKMYHPISIEEGVSYVQLDVLTHLFGVKYERIGDLISFTGEIKPDFTYSPTDDDLSEAIRGKIKALLLMRYPDSQDIISSFNESHPSLGHPRLLFTSWDEVKANLDREPAYRDAANRIINLAESYMELPVVSRELYDGLRGDFPQQILDRGRNLSFAYKITGDKKYKDRLWQEVEVIYETFNDFNPEHQLDPGNSIHGMAYIYDWLYDDWNKETELPIIEEILERCVYSHYDAGYKAATPFLYGVDGYSNFTLDTGNQGIVINAGLLAGAVAFFEKDPEKYGDVVNSILHAITGSVLQFAPDGAWREGGSYWTYTVNSLPVLINNLITGFGTDFDICKVPGLMETANFPISLYGSRGSFKLGDDSGTSKTHGYQMFAARQSNDMSLAKFYKENVGGYDIIALANFVFDDEIENENAEFQLQNNYYFSGMNQVVMKSGQESADTAVILHGGSQEDSHGHRDTGTFLFDMLGERWTAQIVHEDYNLRSYGSYENDGTWNDTEYMPRYYRDKGEAKNVVIANYDSEPGDLAEHGRAQIEKYVTTDVGSYAIMNLTSNNRIYDCAVRGVMLNNITGHIIVEDDCLAKEASDFWWFMTTDAQIEISPDGKSAILSKNNKRISATILTSGNEKFEVLESKPLSEIYPETYGYAITPPLQTPVDGSKYSGEENYKRLAIHNPSTAHFNVSVAFAPLSEGEQEPAVMPEYKHMSGWKFNDGAARAALDAVTINGKPFEAYRPDKFTYTIDVLTEKTAIPKIDVTASGEYELELKEATAIPGITTAILKKDNSVVGIYNFVVTPLNDTTTFVNDKQLPVQSYWATSEPQPENPATALFDGNLTTKYATDEFGGSVTIDYGSVQTISEIQMAFTNGNKRNEYFMIEYSEDGVNWTTAREKGSNSGVSTERESFALNDARARYIRITFFGNSTGASWVSISEICAFTK